MDDSEREIPELVVEALDTTNSAPRDKKQMVIDRLHWLTFSDTIFVALTKLPVS